MCVSSLLDQAISGTRYFTFERQQGVRVDRHLKDPNGHFKMQTCCFPFGLILTSKLKFRKQPSLHHQTMKNLIHSCISQCALLLVVERASNSSFEGRDLRKGLRQSMWETPPFASLIKALEDPSNPIGMRMRAAYFLRTEHANSAKNTDENEVYDDDDKNNNNNINKERQVQVVEALALGLRDERHGSLMRHEFAYIMGQLRDDKCCDALEEILQRDSDCVMVRHEAAEALGAIGAARSKIVLLKVLQEQNANTKTLVPPELTETCQIALDVMEWRESGADPVTIPAACACMLSPYSSVDPAPPHPAHANKTMAELGDVLCDATLPIFERYRAMFSLRNIGGTLAVQQLCRALTQDRSSALLRHEVAYVLGQMQHPTSVEALEESLRRVDEHKMVRHESAEALGAIEGRWDVVERILHEFVNDPDDVVRESCLVALEAADYWGHNNTSQSATTEAAEDEEQNVDEPSSSFSHLKAANNQPPVLANHFNIATS
jgi:deoxyhypusine monooxygenase